MLGTLHFQVFKGHCLIKYYQWVVQPSVCMEVDVWAPLSPRCPSQLSYLDFCGSVSFLGLFKSCIASQEDQCS